MSFFAPAIAAFLGELAARGWHAPSTGAPDTMVSPPWQHPVWLVCVHRADGDVSVAEERPGHGQVPRWYIAPDDLAAGRGLAELHQAGAIASPAPLTTADPVAQIARAA